MKYKIILGLVVLSFVLVGCISLPRKFDRECLNPEFMGSEGMIYNEDLDRAFDDSEPILNAAYRYYDGIGGNALWRCHTGENCVDSDGRNYYKKGTVRYNLNSEEKFHYASSDYCRNDKTLTEKYCRDEGHSQWEYYNCTNGCRDGACLE